MKAILRHLVFCGLLLGGVVSARALTIVRTNDASVAANLSPADVISANAAFDYAATQISTLFNDNVTLNITMAVAPGTATLGNSNSPLLGTFTYAQIRTALINSQTANPSPDGATATAAIPVADPYGATSFSVARGLAKCLGLLGTPNDATLDGTFTFGAGYTYTYDSANRTQPGKIDFIGVAYHEITEIMGRVARLNSTGNGNRPFDVFRFTGAGVMSTNFTDSNVYFSVDGGTTNLMVYNANGNGGDLGDWASGTNDAFNAFSTTGVLNDLTPVDIRVMDVLGWSLVGVAPVVTTNPSNSSLNVGATATFNAAASGTPAPTVQWEVSSNGGMTFSPIGGATSVPLSFTASFADNGKKYRAVFTNASGTATTTAATLSVNRLPVAGPLGMVRYPAQDVKISVAQLFTLGAVSDPDAGDTVTLQGVTNGANGTAQIASGYVFYTPNPGWVFGDSFTYTVVDNHGAASAPATVTVGIITDNAPTNNITKFSKVPASPAEVDFVGIPGFTYGVQYKLNLGDPVWVNIGTSAMNALGAAHFTDNDPVRKAAAAGFYRFIYPAP